METIIASAITGGLALVGVIISNMMAARKTETAIKINQAVTDTKIEELTREVREHNNFAKRMPVLEQKIEGIEEKIRIYHDGH